MSRAPKTMKEMPLPSIAEACEQTLRGRNGVYDVRVTNQDGDLVALFRGASRVIKGEVAPDSALR